LREKLASCMEYKLTTVIPYTGIYNTKHAQANNKRKQIMVGMVTYKNTDSFKRENR